jgi:hypothetical protein
MILRTTITGFLVLSGAIAYGADSSGGSSSGHQNNAYLMNQAMNGDKTAQMMMMMGGGMGGGASDAKYESKRDDLQKAIEQPAKDLKKQGDEANKTFSAAIDKYSEQAAKSFKDSTAKDEKIDEKLAAQISTPPPSNAKMVEDSTNELIASTKSFSDASVAAATAQSRVFLNATPIPAEQTNTMENRLGWTQHASAAGADKGVGGAAQARAPASDANANPALNHNPGANGGAAIPPGAGERGFSSGLIHNMPKGF